MKNVDWMIHYVFATDENDGWIINAHTHGLNKHNHPELMIVLPLSDEICKSLLNSLGIRILNGERFDEECIRTDILEDDFPVKLIKEIVNNKENMVLLLPDENGMLPGNNKCKKVYSDQLIFLENFKKGYENSI